MTIDARDFSPDGQHTGTMNDPWPGVAIKNAIDSLADRADTVMVANGIWLFDSGCVIINRTNWTLQGESRDGAILRFTNVGAASKPEPPGGIWMSRDHVKRECHFTALTFDASAMTMSPNDDYSQLWVSNAENSTMTNCRVLGHTNGGRPALCWEGGGHNTISGNIFDGRNIGGDCCIQFQSGTQPSLDGYYTISNNDCRDQNIVTIGLDHLLIEDNVLTNPGTGGMVAILCCGKWDQECIDVTVNRNTIDVGVSNGVAISGLPNDPGGHSRIDGFNITNNVLNGTFAAIHCQSFDANNYNDQTLAGNEKFNVVISGNKLHSAWGGSGINCRGGAGLVDTVLVENNTLTNDANKPNGLDKDANTRNVTVRGNTGIPNDDGTQPEPIPPEPIPPEPIPPEPIPPEPIPPEPTPEPTKNTVTITVTADPSGSVRYALPGARTGKVKPEGKGKPDKPPQQPPLVTIAVDVDPPDTSIIVINAI
jgi:hypothetical protein